MWGWEIDHSTSFGSALFPRCDKREWWVTSLRWYVYRSIGYCLEDIASRFGHRTLRSSTWRDMVVVSRGVIDACADARTHSPFDLNTQHHRHRTIMLLFTMNNLSKLNYLRHVKSYTILSSVSSCSERTCSLVVTRASLAPEVLVSTLLRSVRVFIGVWMCVRRKYLSCIVVI